MGRSIADARVITAWTASYDPALAVRAGESVRRGREDDEFPGWVWCENSDGLGGWLPGHILSPTGRVLADFDSREASIAAGTGVEVLETCLGWSRVRGPDGAEGWMPSSHLAR